MYIVYYRVLGISAIGLGDAPLLVPVGVVPLLKFGRDVLDTQPLAGK